MLGHASKTYFNSLTHITNTRHLYGGNCHEFLFKKDKFDKILKYKGLGQPHTKTSYNELMKVTHSGQLFFTEVGSLSYHFEKSFWLNI